MKLKNKKGFTLVEIMIVVVIIGLLAAMAVPAFQKVRDNAKNKTAINDMRQVAGAAQQYLMDNPDQSQVALDVLVGNGKYVNALSKGVEVTTDPITTTHTRLTCTVVGLTTPPTFDF